MRKEVTKRRKLSPEANSGERSDKHALEKEHEKDEVDSEMASEIEEENTSNGLSSKSNALDEKDDDSEIGNQQSTQIVSDGRYRNKQRCLTLCSRGVTARYRHLLEDLRTLIPHHKKESKLDSGDQNMGNAVKEIAEMRGCNTVLFLECRKRQDAYLWVGRLGGQSTGPSAKFHVTNIHTMDELRLTGNCMKNSRPILSFDECFGRLEHLKLLKEIFVDIFGTPRGHPKSKPFVDRVMSFHFVDNRIWVRNYQILEQQPESALEARQAKRLSGLKESTSLVEIGPRFVLEPIRIFRGAFGGQTLFQNADFVSPNQVRAAERRKKGRSYEMRKESQRFRKERQEQIVIPEDPLDSVFK